jgi:glycosyltransferase involved in cell wall biosynthesis
MKLLSVIGSMNPISGGPCQGIRNNIPFWIEGGIEPTVVSLDNPSELFVKNDGIIGLGSSNNKWSYTKELKPWLEEHLLEYDVVLVHGLWLYNSYAVYKAIKKLKTGSFKKGNKVPKYFIMPHGMLDPYFQKTKERKWKSIRNSIYWNIIEKKAISEADGLLFTCEEEMQLASSTFKNYQPKTTFNVGYGINEPPNYKVQFKTEFENICSDIVNKRYFLFLSRIHSKKGVDILLYAYLKFVNEHIENNLIFPKLVIAGPGMDTDYGKSILNIVNSDQILKNNVFFPGMIQGDAKWGALYGCEAFILPSHQENFGIAVVEAMACSKPVLISNKVNIWREIENENAGIIEDDTLDGLNQIFNKWAMLSSSEIVNIGKNGFKAYQKNFSAKASSKKFVEVLINTKKI